MIAVPSDDSEKKVLPICHKYFLLLGYYCKYLNKPNIQDLRLEI